MSFQIDKILLGDACAILKVMPDEFVDLTVTSPPYAEQRKKAYGGIPVDKYVEWFLSISHHLLRVTKPTGSFVLNIKEKADRGQRQTYVMELVLALRKQGWLWVDEFIWNKTNPFPTGSRRRLKDGFERCFHFAKTKEYQFFPNAVRAKSTSKWANDNKRRKNKGAFNTTNGSNMLMGQRVVGDLVRPSNVFTFPSSCINIGHPAVFPIEIPNFFIRLMTRKNNLVFDPFIGSGTTALAAQRLKRHYLGIERDPTYVKLGYSRLGPVSIGLNDRQTLVSKRASL